MEKKRSKKERGGLAKKLISQIPKRKKFVLQMSVLERLDLASLRCLKSKNEILKNAIECACEKYRQENLFFNILDKVGKKENGKDCN